MHSSTVRWGRLTLTALAVGAAGFAAGGFIAGAVWLLGFQDLPDGGSGNGREGGLWFGIGGCVGFGIAALAVVARHKRHQG